MNSTVRYLTSNPKKIIDEVLRIKRRLNRKKLPLPCYVYDRALVVRNVRRIRLAFKKAGLKPSIYYALKSNPYPGLLKTLRSQNIAFDISSVHEFRIAQRVGVTHCVYTGPGKTEADLKEIVGKGPKNLIVHLESFQELKNVAAASKTSKKKVICGVRVVPSTHAKWDKFGIPLSSLKAFIHEAKRCANIQLSSIQFHISYVKTSKPYCDALKEVATYLKKNLTASEAAQFTTIDIGGGLYPETVEGEYPWNKEGVLLFEKPGLVETILGLPASQRANKITVEPIEKIAKDIAAAFKRYILPLSPKANLSIEPGRYVSHNAMHFVMQIVDKKNEESVITNAGWNMVGWEKFQFLYYSPIFNLTHWNPAKESSRIVYGNLCIPDDIWGYYLHGDDCKIGDVLLLPFQGAYTYTYRQEFIRGIPPVIEI